jgi:hypothetical protein
MLASPPPKDATNWGLQQALRSGWGKPQHDLAEGDGDVAHCGLLGPPEIEGKKRGQALLTSASAPRCKSSGSEAELQAELNEAWVAHRAGDLAEIPTVR